MKFINQEKTLWSHENHSGNLEDAFYLRWVADGKPVGPYVAPPVETEEQKTKAFLDDPRMADIIAAIEDVTPKPRDTIRNAAIAKARARDGA